MTPSRIVGVAMVMVLVAAGCGSGEPEAAKASEPIAEPGVVSAPSRPVIIDPLPEGWSVSGAEHPEYMPGARQMQTLYLPPGSTPEEGPAIAVGHYGQEAGYTLCGHGSDPGIRLNGEYPSPARFVRSGSLMVLQGEISTDEPGYVFGRDVTEEQLFATARAAQFRDGTALEIPEKSLPSGFRKLVAAPVIPNGTVGESIGLWSDDGENSVSIGAYEGDAAADLMTRFWNATVVKEPCGSIQRTQAARTIEGTDVLISGLASQRIVDQIADAARLTDETGFQAFRAQVLSQPASRLIGGCGVAESDVVVIDGVVGEVRWVLGMTTPPAQQRTCDAFVIDGEIEGGGSGGGGALFAGAGSYGVTLLHNGMTSGRAGSLHVVGGSVPASATRVVISDGGGAQEDAKLVEGGDDPARRFFGALLRPGGPGFAGRTDVVAYDAAGNEVGRYVSPV